MFVAFIDRAEFWAPVFAALSIATMTFGNLVALQQRQAVRLLAYSGIAQAGYMLLPFALAGGGARTDGLAFSVAVAMTVFMVSLAGIPPAGGFWAKFFVFTAAIDRGGLGPWLAAAMVVNSVISLYYYLLIPRMMIFEEGEERPLLRSRLVRGVGGGGGAAGG